MAQHADAAPKRRKPNPAERRRDLCDAAIQLLADDGAKGLSHLKVDRKAGVPDGTTSFYFRTRSALLRAVAERLAELDLANAAVRRRQRRRPGRQSLAVAVVAGGDSSRQRATVVPNEGQVRADDAGHPRSGAGRDPAASHRRIHQAASGNSGAAHAARRRIGVGSGRGSEQHHADVHQRPAAAIRPRATGSSKAPNNSTGSWRRSLPAFSRVRTRGADRGGRPAPARRRRTAATGRA